MNLSLFSWIGEIHFFKKKIEIHGIQIIVVFYGKLWDYNTLICEPTQSHLYEMTVECQDHVLSLNKFQIQEN